MPRLTAPQVLQATGAGTRYAHIPKIVWSTSERQKDIDECLSLGAVRFAIKPATGYELNELINSLEAWLIHGGGCGNVRMAWWDRIRQVYAVLSMKENVEFDQIAGKYFYTFMSERSDNNRLE